MNELPQNLRSVVITRESIYKAAIENYRRSFPSLDAYEVIASRLFITPKNLRAKIAGERHFTVHEEEQFFAVCFYPQGFALKANFVFHPEQAEASK